MTTRYPACGEHGPGLMLIAQAVPGAALVPCIESLQPGWTFGSLDARDGEASFSLDCDRVGDAFVTVVLTPTCEAEGTEVRSDEQATTLTTHVEREGADEYVARWSYAFAGRCAEYEFEVDGPEGRLVPGYVADALTFVERAAVIVSAG